MYNNDNKRARMTKVVNKLLASFILLKGVLAKIIKKKNKNRIINYLLYLIIFYYNTKNNIVKETHFFNY